MARRSAARVVVSAGIGLSALALTIGPAAAEAPRSAGRLEAASSLDVPTSIDHTGTRDVTAELNAFFATVPPGTTVNFPEKGRYHSEGTLTLDGRQNLTIEGHGSVLEATTDGRGTKPPSYQLRAKWPRSRAHVMIRDSSSVALHDLGVVGPNRAGTFSPPLEAQAGFVVVRSRKVVLDGISAKSTYGDGVYIVGKSEDVTIQNCTMDHNGRQGVAIVAGLRTTIENCSFRATARSVIDLEPAYGLVKTVHVQRNRVDGYVNFLLAAVGAGANVEDVWLEQNRVTGGKGVSVYVGVERAVRTGMHIIGNAGDGTSEGFEGALMRFSRFDGVEVRGNRQGVARGVTPVLAHNSCSVTVVDNDFDGARGSAITKSDGDCHTPVPQRTSPSSRIPKARASPPPGRRRALHPSSTTLVPSPAPRSVSNQSREPNPIAIVLAVGIGALAGVGATLLTQWARRQRPT